MSSGRSDLPLAEVVRVSLLLPLVSLWSGKAEERAARGDRQERSLLSGASCGEWMSLGLAAGGRGTTGRPGLAAELHGLLQFPETKVLSLDKGHR